MKKKHKFPLFFKEPVALMERDKRSSYVTLPENFKFASKTNSVPLAVTEFEMACRSYPIVFSSGETVAPVSIVGLRKEENLFLDEESAWLSNTYVPAYIRKYPFIFHQSEGTNLLTLCVDSEYLGDSGTGLAVFKDNSPNTEISAALDFCKNFHAAWQQTESFVSLLSDNNLLFEKRADVEVLTGPKFSLGGFSLIDRDKFEKLINTDEGRERFSSSQIAAVYAHFISLNNWQTLLSLKSNEVGPLE
jgi:hypothetical protein